MNSAVGRRRWSTRLMVEQCRGLTVTSMQRDGVFIGELDRSWCATWNGLGGIAEAWLNYSVGKNSICGIVVRLDTCLITGASKIQLAGQMIQTTTTKPHLGGQRFWFRCACGQRVRNLYLPPGQQVFRCRNCFNLTYRSCREHDKRVDLLARNPALFAAMHSADLEWQMLASSALPRLGKLLERGKISASAFDEIADEPDSTAD